MKRVSFAVAILLIIPVSILLGQSYLKKATVSMSGTISSAEKAFREDNRGEAEKALQDFKGSWEKSHQLLGTFIRHSELDTINLNASKLSPYLENDQKAEFCAECEEIKAQLEHLWKMERFTLDNIL